MTRVVKLTRNTIVGEGLDGFAGDTVTVPVDTADRLVKSGKAVYADGDAPADAGIVTVNGDPMVDDTPTKKLKTR